MDRAGTCRPVEVLHSPKTSEIHTYSEGNDDR